MNERDRIQSYLQSLTYNDIYTCEPPARRGPYPFVTISRQTGAGGHSLAKLLLETMHHESNQHLFGGWTLFDAPACMELLERVRLRIPFESLVAEEYHTPLQELLFELFGDESPQEQIVLKITATLRALASHGKVIILGRGGAFLTRNLSLGIHVRLVAPLPVRIERIRIVSGVSAEEARRMIEKRDLSRSQFVRDFFDKNIEDPQLYDAVMNTRQVELQHVSDFLVKLIKERAASSEKNNHQLTASSAA